MNVMMDASHLYSKGFHPVLDNSLPDLSDIARPVPRLAATEPVKYYFIDLGISVHIPRGCPRFVLGTAGLDQEVPELSNRVPYDPFQVDIFILGDMLEQTVCTVRNYVFLTRFAHVPHSYRNSLMRSSCVR